MPSLSASYANGTLAVSLLNPLASGNPTSVQVSLLGQTITLPFDTSTWTATLSVSIHPSVAGFNVTGLASIPASEQTTPPIGSTGFWLGNPAGPAPGPATDPLQLVAPSASGQPYWVYPTRKATLQAYYQGLLNAQTHVASVAQQFQDLYVAVSVLLHAMCEIVLPALTKAGTVTLDANASNALNDLQTNVVPNLVSTLETIYPSGGQRQPLYADLVAVAQVYQQAAEAYQQALAVIPNLQ